MRNVMTEPYNTPEPGQQPAIPRVDPFAPAPIAPGMDPFARPPVTPAVDPFAPAPAAQTTPEDVTAPVDTTASLPTLTGAGPAIPQQYPPAYPATYPASYPPVSMSPAPPKRKRRVGLIVGIVLTVILLLCAGGGTTAYFLVQNARPIGQANPDKATLGFLVAIYTDHDATAATRFVCPTARDSAKITKVINDLAAFEQQYDSPTVTWDTPVISAEKVTGTAHISLTFKTEDERVASKKLVLDLLNNRGWWVCDVRPES
jgi:hypothetical protein